MRRKDIVDVVNEEIGQGEDVHISEITAGDGVDVVSDRVGPKDFELEKFMNEVLTIMVFEDNQEGSLDTVEPTVRGRKQIILRGVPSKVKRMYVEVLARSRTTKYKQYQRHPEDRTSLYMQPKVRLVAPFSVIHDPNPRGSAWLKGILAEA